MSLIPPRTNSPRALRLAGDESYHADCFRCRSCSNRIEELIFAKTQQGIWCMACHNERVARTRKHAEAKRKARKEKEKDATASRSSRTRSEGGRSSSIGGDADRTAELPEVPPPPALPAPGLARASGKNDSISPVRPLPKPSPYQRSVSFDSTQHQRSTTNSSDSARLGATLPPSSSIQSISSLSRSTTPLQPPSAAHSRSPSQLSAYNGEPTEAQRRTTPSALRREITDVPRRHSDGFDDPPPDFSPYPVPESPALQPHKRREESDGLLQESSTSRSGSLSAPSGVDKAANRRSGFYGAAARPSLGEDAILSQLDDSRSVGRDSPAPPADRDHRTQTPPTSPPRPHARSTSQDLHASASFYDPDTLLFLNHVGGSAPSSPRVGSSSKAAPELVLNVDDIARLPSPGPVDVSGDEDESGGREGGKSEVARRVRESIQMQRRESSGRAGGEGDQPLSVAGLDVELVEMLLAELETTKREMKELKSKYNAFRVSLMLRFS